MSDEEIAEKPAPLRCRMANPRTDNKGYTPGEPAYLGKEAVCVDARQAAVNHVFSQPIPEGEPAGPLTYEGNAHFKIVAIAPDTLIPLVKRLTPEEVKTELARIEAEKEARKKREEKLQKTEENRARVEKLIAERQRKREKAEQRQLREEGVLPATPQEIERESNTLKESIDKVFNYECGNLLPKITAILTKHGVQLASNRTPTKEYLREIVVTINSVFFHLKDQLKPEETKILEYFRYVVNDISSLFEEPTKPSELKTDQQRHPLQEVLQDAQLIFDSRFNIQLSRSDIDVTSNQRMLIMRIISLLQRTNILTTQSFLDAKKYADGSLKVAFKASNIDMTSIPMLICKRAARQAKNASFSFSRKEDVIELIIQEKRPTGGLGGTSHL